MNDRFKFRVWSKKYNEYIPSNMIGTLLNFGYKDEYHIEFMCLSSFSDDLIIEQCTGFSDKIGNLIYEGDLIKSPNNSHPLAVYHDVNGLWRCKENRPNGIWELPLYDMVRNYTVEIIGNIHKQVEQKDVK